MPAAAASAEPAIRAFPVYFPNNSPLCGFQNPRPFDSRIIWAYAVGSFRRGDG